MKRVRIALRLAAMVALLAGCVALFSLWQLLPGRNPWPQVFLGTMAKLAGVRVRTVGTPAKRALFLANHASWIDILALAGKTDSAFVAHSGLAGHGALKALCDMNQTVFIARHDRASVGDQVEQVRAAMAGAKPLTIFPEGTTSDGTAFLPFKSSLLSAIDPPPPGVAIQPVLLDYGADAGEVAWLGNEPGPANFFKILGRGRAVELTIHFLPPLSSAALAGRKAIAAAAEAAVRVACAKARALPKSAPLR
jgi:1-acyl-sn-glycerol-3-phosphate acyltransferase